MNKGEITCDQQGEFHVICLDLSSGSLVECYTNLSFNSFYNVNSFLVHGTSCGWYSLVGYNYFGCGTYWAYFLCKKISIYCMLCLEVELVIIIVWTISTWQLIMFYAYNQISYWYFLGTLRLHLHNRIGMYLRFIKHYFKIIQYLWIVTLA